MKRLVTAALAGGMALFAWEAVSHMLTPLGEAGIQAVPNESALMTVLKSDIPQSGLYLFPAPEERPGMTGAQRSEAMTAAQERWRTGPTGMLIFHPQGLDAMSPRQLLVQLLADVIAMLAAAAAVSAAARSSFWQRAGLITALGLLPALQAELPTWNWYGFPGAYVLAQSFVHLAGFFFGGLVVARLMRAGPARADAAGQS